MEKTQLTNLENKLSVRRTIHTYIHALNTIPLKSYGINIIIIIGPSPPGANKNQSIDTEVNLNRMQAIPREERMMMMMTLLLLLGQYYYRYYLNYRYHHHYYYYYYYYYYHY